MAAARVEQVYRSPHDANVKPLAPLPRIVWILPLAAFGLCVLTGATSAALEASGVSPDSRFAMISRIAKMIAFDLFPISLAPLLLRGCLLFNAAANPLLRNPTAYAELGAQARGLYVMIERNERRVAIALCGVFALLSIMSAMMTRDFIFEHGSTPTTTVPTTPKTIVPPAAVDECVRKVTKGGQVTRHAAEAWCDCAAHMTKEHECDAELKGVVP